MISALSLAAGAAIFAPVAVQAQADAYLPLSDNAKWVLRSPAMGAPATFEVVGREGDGYRIRATNPWGASDFVLEPQGSRYLMTQFGSADGMMKLPEQPVFLDFSQDAGKKWSNSLGDMQNMARNATVKTAQGEYRDAIRFRHSPKGGDPLFYTFAKGVGFVQFGEGNSAFVLDEGASTLPGRGATTTISRAANTNDRAANAPQAPPPRSTASTIPSSGSMPLIGLTPNRLPNEANTPDNLIKAFQRTVDLGVQYLVGNSTWAELEPRPGQYELGSLNYLLSVARENNLPLSYTIRVINTNQRGTPADLNNTRWSDSKMKDRAVKLIERIVPVIKDQTPWLMFGYEVDPYMRAHSGEVDAFVDLFKTVKARVKQLAPNMQVSATITGTDMGDLEGRLRNLNSELDFLALTYIPMEAGWTVDDPDALPRDFARMREIAGSRKIVLQEIAYPTASINKGSEQKQAEFYRLAFQEWAKAGGQFAAVNFMTYADLADDDARNLAAFYGQGNSQAFVSVLQTLGLHDEKGQPKLAWQVLQEHMQRQQPQQPRGRRR